jgi:hypothetical protein
LFLESSRKILESLFIKQSDGGVLKQFYSGVSIEENPNEIPLYTLNGWLTAIINVKRYTDVANSEPAKGLFSKNVDSVERIINLYDVEELANSRYHLSGLCSLKLRFLNGFKPIIIRGLLRSQEESFHKIPESENDYSNYIKTKDVDKSLSCNYRRVETNIVLSMISFPMRIVYRLSWRLLWEAK